MYILFFQLIKYKHHIYSNKVKPEKIMLNPVLQLYQYNTLAID